MEVLENVLTQISDLLWGYPLIILLFGTHLFLTFRLRFIQRFIGKAIKISLRRDKEGKGDISQFGALTTALAATIGTGNIVGVSTAVATPTIFPVPIVAASAVVKAPNWLISPLPSLSLRKEIFIALPIKR